MLALTCCATLQIVLALNTALANAKPSGFDWSSVSGIEITPVDEAGASAPLVGASTNAAAAQTVVAATAKPEKERSPAVAALLAEPNRPSLAHPRDVSQLTALELAQLVDAGRDVRMHLAGTLSVNEWNDQRTVQLVVDDAAVVLAS